MKMAEGMKALGEMYLEASKGTSKEAPTIETLHDMAVRAKQNEDK